MQKMMKARARNKIKLEVGPKKVKVIILFFWLFDFSNI